MLKVLYKYILLSGMFFALCYVISFQTRIPNSITVEISRSRVFFFFSFRTQWYKMKIEIREYSNLLWFWLAKSWRTCKTKPLQRCVVNNSHSTYFKRSQFQIFSLRNLQFFGHIGQISWKFKVDFIFCWQNRDERAKQNPVSTICCNERSCHVSRNALFWRSCSRCLLHHYWYKRFLYSYTGEPPYRTWKSIWGPAPTICPLGPGT